MIIAISILSVVAVIFILLTINLLRKNEKQEDILLEYLTYLDKLSKTIELSDKKLKEVDRQGAFANDDEVGHIFKSILQIQDILNDFQLKKIK